MLTAKSGYVRQESIIEDKMLKIYSGSYAYSSVFKAGKITGAETVSSEVLIL